MTISADTAPSNAGAVSEIGRALTAADIASTTWTLDVMGISGLLSIADRYDRAHGAPRSPEDLAAFAAAGHAYAAVFTAADAYDRANADAPSSRQAADAHERLEHMRALARAAEDTCASLLPAAQVVPVVRVTPRSSEPAVSAPIAQFGYGYARIAG